VSRAAKVLLSVAFCALVLAPAGARADEQRIAPGVSAGGVDLSNLTVPEAATLLDQRLTPLLGRTVRVHVAGRHFALSAKTVKLRFDSLLTAKRAYYAGLGAPAQTPSGGGAPSGTTVPLAVSHAHLVVRSFAARVARVSGKRARDATVRITVRRVYARHSRTGRRLDAVALANAVDAAFDDPIVARELFPPRVVVRPRVTANTLARVYGTVITIDRRNFTLRLFKHLRIARRYGIAVGQAGLETPPGRYRIRNKQVNPAWHVPNSAWAGSLAGQTIPGGVPGNPLKARWLGIANGVGIHGTAEDWSIGTAASHGCIRMHVSDVVALYPRVPVGTPVLIR
jgi:lipoprotein-anchoring transpeptidase ErfK/SrfK